MAMSLELQIGHRKNIQNMFDGRINKGVGFAKARKYTTHANYPLEPTTTTSLPVRLNILRAGIQQTLQVK